VGFASTVCFSLCSPASVSKSCQRPVLSCRETTKAIPRSRAVFMVVRRIVSWPSTIEAPSVSTTSIEVARFRPEPTRPNNRGAERPGGTFRPSLYAAIW
jgi:hypothetical protein